MYKRSITVQRKAAEDAEEDNILFVGICADKQKAISLFRAIYGRRVELFLPIARLWLDWRKKGSLRVL